MDTWPTRFIALALALALFPGAFEALENAIHLVTKGHPAHLVAALAFSSASAEDHEEPEGDEHGCTPVFHLCSCHSSLTSLCPSRRPPVQLADTIFRFEQRPRPPLAGFSPPLDRPPQA